jgi:hypothetical protein
MTFATVNKQQTVFLEFVLIINVKALVLDKHILMLIHVLAQMIQNVHQASVQLLILVLTLAPLLKDLVLIV